MTRYYCKNCDTEINFDANGVSLPKELTVKWEKIVQEKGIKDKCPICGFEYEKIPDYETPAQYEKRTGAAYPDNGIIFEQLVAGDGLLYWSSNDYKSADKQNRIVVADPPVPPPDDFVPEGESMKYNGVEFDDFTNGDGDGVWSQLCKKHAKKFDKSLLSECPGEPICGVEGCDSIASYYIDFPKEGV